MSSQLSALSHQFFLKADSGELKAEYTLIRSRRRSIGLQIRKDAALFVRAPFFVPRKMIENFIRDKQTWIEKTRQRILADCRPAPQKDFLQTGKILYRGQEYPLEVSSKSCTPLCFQETHFLISEEYRPHAKKMFEHWCRARAEEIIPDRVRHYAQKADVSYQSIKINSARTRWGSCSERGTLNFSWRIMMVPPAVMDYVAAHEVAHLVHPNHSRFFWSFVAQLCPEYRAGRKWLKTHGNHLMD